MNIANKAIGPSTENKRDKGINLFTFKITAHIEPAVNIPNKINDE